MSRDGCDAGFSAPDSLPCERIRRQIPAGRDPWSRLLTEVPRRYRCHTKQCLVRMRRAGPILFASRPKIMGQVLGIVCRVIATHLFMMARFSRKTAQAGDVTLIQRFGSALDLNIHFHMLFLEGLYIDSPDGAVRFRWVKAPTSAELTQLAHTIAAGSTAIWNGKVCWNRMPRTANWPRMRWMASP